MGTRGLKFFYSSISLYSLVAIAGLSFTGCTQKNELGLKISAENETLENQNKGLSAHPQDAWVCPMHPQVKMDHSGQCPICGMDLVQYQAMSGGVEDQSRSHIPEGHAPFTLANNRIQLIGVKYGKVEKKIMFKSIEAAGRVAFDPELYTAQNEFVEAVKQLERVKDTPLSDVKHSALKMVESAKLRLKILGLSDRQISRLRLAEKSNTGSNLLITSPGESVWIYADVFEMDLSSVEAGQQVKIFGGALEGKELFGNVESVDRVINPSTRTAKIRILVPKAKAQLRPEAFVNVSILSPLGEQIVIPFDAVLDSGKEAWVFVAKEEGHFEPRTIVINHYVGDEITVASGLVPGERIVTSANFLVDSESRLRGVISSQAGAFAGENGEDKDKSGSPPEMPKTPKCPPGQEWHESMKHCMTKVGG